MTTKRLLTSLSVFACLLPAGPAAASDSGGAAVPSFDETGGGIVAPAGDPSGVAESAGSSEAPPAAPAQDDTPTTPEGEEQPPGGQNGEDDVPPDEETVGPIDGLPENGAARGTGGSLPQTGFELAALTAIGLGLLLAGGALWPTSAWPPPRERASRSLPRR